MADNEKIGLKAVWDNADFNKGQKEYVDKISKASGATSSVAAAMGSGAGGLSMAVVGVGTALGSLAAGAIRNVISGLSEMSGAIVTNLGDLQKLEIGLTMLEAREMTMAGLTDTVAEAMDGASLRASSMLEVLKDVSLASPFQYQDIAKVLQLNMAFGQSSKMAMALTQAMTDMAAVSPMASPELLERIAYNFSQMSLTGKITARDIRDLALAGVNLNQILVEELGGGMDVVNQKLKEGELTMKDVSQAFIDYAETNFAGAARSMATKTIPGLISSFKDLGVFASKDLFGPAGEVVTKFMEKVYYAAKNLLDSGVLQKIGIWLKVLAETATNFLSKLFGLTESVAQQASATASAVTTAVSDVVTETLDIATTEAEKTIADFNTIGLDSAIAWLEGFSSADYSVLNSIQGYLSTLSSNLASELGMEGYEAQQLFANLFANITEAISGGNMESAFSIIIDQFGEAGAKVVELARANMALADSENAVTAAQKNLTAANNQLTAAQNKLAAAEKAQDKAMSKIDKTTWEYNEALRKGASPEILKAKFNQINAAYDEYEASNKAIEAAEDEVDVSEAQIDIAEEQVALAKEQQKVLQEQADTVKNLVDVLMQFAKAQQAAADATTSAIEDIEDEYTQLAEITPEDIFAPSLDSELVAQQLADYEAMVRDKINAIFGTSLKETLSNLWDLAWGAVNDSFVKYTEETWPESWDEYEEQVKTKFGIMTDGMGEDFVNAWNWYWDIYKRNAKTAYETVWSWLKTSWNWYWTEYKQNAITAYTYVWDKIKEGWQSLVGIVEEIINTNLTNLSDKFNDLKDNALQWFIDKIGEVRQSLFDLRDNLKAIGDWISYLWGLITGFVQNPLSSLASMWDWLAGLFGYSGGGASGSSSGISGSTSGAQGSVIPSAYTTQSTVSTVSNTTGATVINLTVGDINNGMDLNALTQYIKQVTGGSLVYG
jgi:tape measure domain-containing protein